MYSFPWYKLSTYVPIVDSFDVNRILVLNGMCYFFVCTILWVYCWCVDFVLFARRDGSEKQNDLEIVWALSRGAVWIKKWWWMISVSAPKYIHFLQHFRLAFSFSLLVSIVRGHDFFAIIRRGDHSSCFRTRVSVTGLSERVSYILILCVTCMTYDFAIHVTSAWGCQSRFREFGLRLFDSFDSFDQQFNLNRNVWKEDQR